MKKILLSILAIALTVSTVSATAYSLFTDTASVQGMTFTSGNADVQVALDKLGGGTYETSFSDNVSFWSALNSHLFGNLYPGKEDWGYFRLKNNSASAIPLALTGKLKNGVSGDWEGLKDKIQIGITKDNGDGITGWHTLNEWNSAPISMGSLAINEILTYKIYVRVLDAGNEIANMKLSSVQFDIIGTQK